MPPEIVGGGDELPSSVFECCIEVEIGGTSSYNCINEKLSRQVDRVSPVANLPLIDTRSSNIQSGVA